MSEQPLSGRAADLLAFALDAGMSCKFWVCRAAPGPRAHLRLGRSGEVMNWALPVRSDLPLAAAIDTLADAAMADALDWSDHAGGQIQASPKRVRRLLPRRAVS